jgi:hypothetical protein
MPKVMPVMVSFFTYGWTQRCVMCFQKWFPELKILVVDNNPTSIKQMEHWNWKYNAKEKWKHFFPYCLAERDWLEQQDNVILLKPDIKKKQLQQIRHGQAIDFAVNWCKENNIDIMLCMEPDSNFTDTLWFYDFLNPILHDDKWVAAFSLPPRPGKEMSHAVSPCPIMVKINEIKWSFDHVAIDQQYYDFAQWVWQKCKERGRSQIMPKPKGFKHFWSGSYRDFVRNSRNCPFITYL